MDSYAKIRERIYASIEKERQLKITFMCKKCDLYKNDNCSVDKCVKEVRRSRINENSKSKDIKVKRSRVQSKD